ncbi:mediator of RNA polymerase II transcription subunit 18 [Entelurus aequoreus]|uniref:mediator of RNA polymerase II transcription subunit 18 n=1 Tax=Entelurus aequoreus TaxID=161455 RepID=UPI002B1D6670|nr:mediator of RNA polymerase II transcription subunit 18 [Entelurus aequoreus]XP_061919944.1 mediator of RNA polymerase II transcription subunit 18 [Entelurus aequoreus]
MEAPPVTVMPVTGGTINMMEYLLQGSVLDQALESLLHRLRGLCDNIEPEAFTDHELVYLLKGQQGNPFILRARRSLAHPTAPWHLRYLGQPEVGDKSRHALVRNCVDVAASHSLPEFLNEMGFRMDHEFVANGHMFRKGAMKVVVSKLSRILVPGNTDNTERLSLSYLVELSVLAPAGQDTVSEDMRSFAEQLKPLVHLEKIDPSKQRH